LISSDSFTDTDDEAHNSPIAANNSSNTCCQKQVFWKKEYHKVNVYLLYSTSINTYFNVFAKVFWKTTNGHLPFPNRAQLMSGLCVECSLCLFSAAMYD
jgi:hypothetical protein